MPSPSQPSESHREQKSRRAGSRLRLTAACVALPAMIAAVHLALHAGRDAVERQPTLTAAHAATPATETDWPNLFGPHHDSSTGQPINTRWPDSGPPELWRTAIGTGYSSPVVSHDRAIVAHRIGDEELVSAFDAASGTPLWEHRRPTSFECGSHYTNGPYSTPAISGDQLISLGAQGRLECLNVETGELLWFRETGDEFQVPTDVFGAGHSPRIFGGLAILNIGGTTPESGIVAFDMQSGDVRWQATSHGASFATPVLAELHGRERLVALTADALVVLDPADGRTVSEFACRSNVPDAYTAVTPVVFDNLILVSIFGYGSVCLEIRPDESLNALWEDRRTLTSQYNPLLCADGAVYGIHATDKSFRCIDLRTGQLHWRWKSSLGRSTHLIAGDQILLFGEFGELAAIQRNPVECVPTATVTPTLFDGERCYSAPALAEGLLYVRNEAELVCIDLRPVRVVVDQ